MNNRAEAAYTAVLLLFIIIIVLIVYSVTQQPKINSPIETAPNLTASPSSINWGTIKPGETVTRSVTLTNTGTSPTQALTMTSTSTVGTVTWDAEGLTVNNQTPLVITFSLTVYASASQGPFNFTITING